MIDEKEKNVVDFLIKKMAHIHKHWDGKESILEMKKNGSNQWRQMEWFGFYFEYKFEEALGKDFKIGETFGSTQFDYNNEINWDLKSKAIKTDDHKMILNDVESIQNSIRKNGSHGLIIALCDVEYNDNDRTFQKWHSELKGGLSKYEKERKERTSISRYRKTQAILEELIFIVLKEKDLEKLSIHKQGRNSNGKPRPPKYMLNLKDIEYLSYIRIEV